MPKIILNPDEVFGKDSEEFQDTLVELSEKKNKVADALVQLAHIQGIELILDQDSEPHVIFSDKPMVAFPITSNIFRRWLSGLYYEETNKGFSGSTFEQVAMVLEGKAYHEQNKKILHNRLAKVENTIYYDLGDDKRVVVINEKGWKVSEESSVLFRRFSHQLPQVVPEAGGQIKKFLDFVNLKSNDDKILVLTYLVAVLIPDIARVILICVGDQGSAKSTLLRLIRSLVDPSRTELLKLRSSSDELSQTASHHYCLYLDNISYMSTEASDSLATFATGIGFSKRKLYSDDEDIIYDIKTAVALDGVNLMASRPDFLDRSLILELKRIPDHLRVEEKIFLDDFNSQKPKILGALFDTLSKVLAEVLRVILDSKPRMADFARYATAASKILGFGTDRFLSAFSTNVKRQNQAAVESSPTAQVILEFMRARDEWEGTPSELYEELENLAQERKLQIGGTYGFPKSSSWLIRKINEVRTNLLSLGIEAETGDRTETSKLVKLSKIGQNAVIGVNDVKPASKDLNTINNNDIKNAVKEEQPQNNAMSPLTAKKRILDKNPSYEEITKEDLEKSDDEYS